jgi:hypothetical protein
MCVCITVQYLALVSKCFFIIVMEFVYYKIYLFKVFFKAYSQNCATITTT